MAALLIAQQIAGAAQFEILHGYVEARAERGVLRDGGEPVMRLLGHRLGRIVQEVRIRALTSTTDAATQLMQLAQAEAVGMVDDQRVGVGDIKAGFDDGGAYQHVDVAMPEVADHTVKLFLPHLAVGYADMRFGHELVDFRRDGGDVLHTIVHVEHLPTTQQLAPDGGGDLRVLVSADVGEHRQAILRRRGQRGHFADTGDSHFQRARDRRCRQAQHVHIGAQRLERLLVLDAETLFLVDDDESQILELDLRIEQLVRADDHIHGTVFKPLDGLVNLLGGLESAHGSHVHGEAFETFGESLEMLLHEQCGRHEHGHLLGILHRLERGAHRDFGFAEAHIAADQTVHRNGFLHIRLDLVDGGELVGRLLIGESVLQLLLPRRVLAEGIAFRTLACRVELDQILGDLMHMLARLGFGGGPVGTAQLVEFRRFGADVFADLVELVGGDEQFVRRGAALGRRIFDDQVFASGFVGAGADDALTHFDEPANAVLLVHHVIAFFELHQVDGLAPAFRRFGHGHG